VTLQTIADALPSAEREVLLAVELVARRSTARPA